jgi:Uma2 family endonuclease
MAQGLTESFTAAQPLKRWKMSFDEFLIWDGDGNTERRVEWVNGEVIELPRITKRHNMIVGFLITLFQILHDVRRTAQVFFEPFTMRPEPGGNGRCPDIFLVRKENKDRIQERFLDGPADLVIEVVSESSTKDDYFVKLAEYRRAGVPEYWIIDPIADIATFLLLGEDKDYHDAPINIDGKFASPALDGMQIDPKWFQQEDMPKVFDILKEWSII